MSGLAMIRVARLLKRALVIGMGSTGGCGMMRGGMVFDRARYECTVLTRASSVRR